MVRCLLIGMVAFTACGGEPAAPPDAGEPPPPQALLDESFGTDGYARFSASAASVEALEPRAGGGFVALVHIYPANGTRRYGLVALDDDGRLDGGFGSSGQVDLAGVFGSVTRLRPAGDGGWVVAGTCASGVAHCIQRLTGAGDPDPAFGVDGVVTIDPAMSFVTADVAVDAAGRFVWSAGREVGRLTATGTPDPSFGTDGTVAIPVEAARLAIQASGRIVVADDTNLDLYGVTAAGAVDATFGGEASGGADGNGRASNLLVAGEDRLYAGGRGQLGGLLVVRYTAAGRVDPSFGDAGRALVTVEGSVASGVVELPDGRIAVASASGVRGVVLWFSPAGEWLSVDSTAATTWGAIAIDAGGRVVVGGAIRPAPNTSEGIVFARYLPQ